MIKKQTPGNVIREIFPPEGNIASAPAFSLGKSQIIFHISGERVRERENPLRESEPRFAAFSGQSARESLKARGEKQLIHAQAVNPSCERIYCMDPVRCLRLL